ncbi:MAG TPA: hypothetical protein VHO06_06205 [Polyangia bacterium]|nr:hypothetical protein [Polyangia bacterium]
MSAAIFSPPDGLYTKWDIALSVRYPLALSEMRWPSVPLGKRTTRPLARWGIECQAGWRSVVERLLDQLEAEIEAQPLDRRDAYRIVQIKEKLGRLTVYLASKPTDAMWDAIEAASEQSTRVCEVCGEPGELAERPTFLSVRCHAHANWRPWNRPPG